MCFTSFQKRSRSIFSQRNIHIPDFPADSESVRVQKSITVITVSYFTSFLLIFTLINYKCDCFK